MSEGHHAFDGCGERGKMIFNRVPHLIVVDFAVVVSDDISKARYAFPWNVGLAVFKGAAESLGGLGHFPKPALYCLAKYFIIQRGSS